ncbi:type II toxin-antitoxin system RelE/ParE family toxin [Duganella sp. FT3S]|uniref:Type II toxin-antitoxin system RelE/ParE family toxin n=1 Tax=Rugamonas fusca TaxID=2758568 RepID=A0A7W2ELR9_9BURK|nr:type II toxin-antitoxin system RelE/ParE family toxin [Rugamonas fusca]MBA5608287.1 type II toxin-antitoxin system RelE/ParE family toxin [Rugamonas fusca]
MKIIWTRYALNDLQEIQSYLKQSESPAYAQKIVRAILDEVKTLQERDTKGTFIPELEDLNLTTYRQLLAGQNRIIIERGQDAFYVHLVAHTSRNLEALIRRRLMSPQ